MRAYHRLTEGERNAGLRGYRPKQAHRLACAR